MNALTQLLMYVYWTVILAVVIVSLPCVLVYCLLLDEDLNKPKRKDN